METEDLLLTPRRAGFSLIEIFVTLGILAVLLSIGLPALGQFRDRSKALSCASNLRGIGSALNLYLVENQMRMPVLLAAKGSIDDPGETIDTLLAPYISSPDLFRCPADDEGLHEQTGTSYFWNSLLNNQPTVSLRFLLTTDQARIPVLADKEDFHRDIGHEVNILYADGRVEKEVSFSVNP